MTHFCKPVLFRSDSDSKDPEFSSVIKAGPHRRTETSDSNFPFKWIHYPGSLRSYLCRNTEKGFTNFQAPLFQSCYPWFYLSLSLLHWSVSFLFYHPLISTFTHKYEFSVPLGADTDTNRCITRDWWNRPGYLLIYLQPGSRCRSCSVLFHFNLSCFSPPDSSTKCFCPSNFRGRLPNSELRKPTIRNWLIIWRTANITRWSRVKTRRRRSDLQPVRPNIRLSLGL